MLFELVLQAFSPTEDEAISSFRSASSSFLESDLGLGGIVEVERMPLPEAHGETGGDKWLLVTSPTLGDFQDTSLAPSGKTNRSQRGLLVGGPTSSPLPGRSGRVTESLGSVKWHQEKTDLRGLIQVLATNGWISTAPHINSPEKKPVNPFSPKKKKPSRPIDDSVNEKKSVFLGF